MPRHHSLQTLSDESLAESAGDTVFQRGRSYAIRGRCALVREADASSTWRVQGTRDYEVELSFDGSELRAQCICPYAQDGATCKHIVASALAWRMRLAPDAEGVAEVEAADRHAKLREFILGRSTAELADRLWSWAQNDRELMAQLKAWRAESQAASEPGAWKEAIGDLLRKTRDFYDWSESTAYARRAEAVLPLLRRLAAANAVDACDACVFALRRLFKVCEHADDSGGQIGEVLHAIHAELIQALGASPPQGRQAERWVATWLKLQDEDPWGLWDDEAMLDAAGPDVAQSYAVRVAKDWAKWLERRPPAAPSRRTSRDREYDPERERLRGRYLDDLRRCGDDQGLLDALQSDVAGSHEVLQIAEQLEAMGREREALRRLEAMNKEQPDDWRIESALLRAYARDGCADDVLAICRRQLERRPDAQNFAATLEAARTAGRDVAAYRDELYCWAEEHTERRETGSGWRVRARPPGSESASRDITVRMWWLLHEKRFDEALQLARTPGSALAETVVLDLASGIAASHPADAAAMIRRVLDTRMRGAQSPYREEIDLVRRWLALLSTHDAQEGIAALRTEYRSRRRFVAELDALARA